MALMMGIKNAVRTSLRKIPLAEIAYRKYQDRAILKRERALTQMEFRSDVDAVFASFSETMPDLIRPRTKSQLDFTYHVLEKVFVPHCKIIDLGGGLNPLNGVIAALGGSVTVLDIFEYDLGWVRASKSNDFAEDCARKREHLESVGVRFIDCDIAQTDLRKFFSPESVDAITSYHCLEHLHQSPKAVLESALTVLKPGGRMLIEVPNAINLLKRIKVLMGHTNHGSYTDYYDSANFTGHVREYSISDLYALAERLRLSEYRIYGKNWYGTLFDRLGNNPLTQLADLGLQQFPGLCGSLFLYFVKSI